MDFSIEGEDGNFGSFLKQLLEESGHAVVKNCLNVILAVPFSSYEDACRKNKYKHLINVCSIQEESTEICLEYSPIVTSIHPLFGRRTTGVKRIAITYYGNYSSDVLSVFKKISDEHEYISPVEHDIIMSKTHKQVVMLHDQIKSIVEAAKDVPDHFLTPSFLRLKELSDQYLDMPKGTRDSILANKR
jgi:prephenate dehydrogenase